MHIAHGNRSALSNFEPSLAPALPSPDISLNTSTGLSRGPTQSKGAERENGEFCTGISTASRISAFANMAVLKGIAAVTMLALAADSFLHLRAPAMGMLELALTAYWSYSAYRTHKDSRPSAPPSREL